MLKFWRGPNFKSQGGGNNIPNNSFPWDKKDEMGKVDGATTAKIFPGKTEEVYTEVVDGNEANGDEATEVEGNKAGGDDAVGGNTEVKGKNVDGEKALDIKK